MDKQAVDTMPVGTMPAELSQFTDEQLRAQVTPVDPKPADVVRREEHDLTRMTDEAKGWSKKEAAMFLELVERRLQSMEARLAQLEAR